VVVVAAKDLKALSECAGAEIGKPGNHTASRFPRGVRVNHVQTRRDGGICHGCQQTVYSGDRGRCGSPALKCKVYDVGYNARQVVPRPFHWSKHFALIGRGI
jgi:hypothetical protein